MESFIDAESGSFVNIIARDNEDAIQKRFDDYLILLKQCLPDWKIIKEVSKGNLFIQLQNADKNIIELKCNTLNNQKDNYELILQIMK